MINVKKNRGIFLKALRSGDYHKGTIKVDSQGRPLGVEAVDEGYCAVGLMDSLFNPTFRTAPRLQSLGLKQAQITVLQQDWNDSELTFPQIADLVENRFFG